MNIVAIATFTRLLGPEAYGRYAMVLAVSTMLVIVGFQWLRLSVTRLVPADPDQRFWFFGGILRLHRAVALLLIGIALMVVLIDRALLAIVGGVLALTLASARYELSAEVSRSTLRPTLFAVQGAVRALLGLAVGLLMVRLGFGWFGVVGGGVAGALVGVLVGRGMPRSATEPLESTAESVHSVLRFGLPLALVGMVDVVLSWSDRLIIGGLLGAYEVGVYSAAYDIPRQSLGLVMMAGALASLPIAVRAYESHGAVAASELLSRSFGLLMLAGVPITVGLCLVRKDVAVVLLPSEFAETAESVIPWVAVGVFVQGLRAFSLDHAFQLSKRPYAQLVPGVVAVTVNGVLNLLFLPRYGVMVAAYATLAAYVVAFAVAFPAARSLLPFRIPRREAAISLAGALIMAAGVYAIPANPGVLGLTLRATTGAAVYLLTCAILLSRRERNRVSE